MTTLEAESRVELRPAPDPRVERAARALGPLIRALGDDRDFAIRFWDGRGIRPHSGVEQRFTLVIRRPGALSRMFVPPRTSDAQPVRPGT